MYVCLTDAINKPVVKTRGVTGGIASVQCQCLCLSMPVFVSPQTPSYKNRSYNASYFGTMF